MSSTQEVGEIFGAGTGPAHAMLRSPTVLIAAVGLWGLNVLFFRIFRIDYVTVLQYDLQRIDGDGGGGNNNSMTAPSSNLGSISSAGDGLTVKAKPQPITSNNTDKEVASVRQRSCKYDEYLSESDDEEDDTSTGEMFPLKGAAAADGDQSNSVTWLRLVCLSLLLLILLHATYFYWIDILQGGSIGAVFMFYGAVTVAILIPCSQTKWLRKATQIVLWRVGELIRPRCSTRADGAPRPIPFVDVFVADAMCSLSKVFFDWGMLIHMAVHYPHPVPKDYHVILFPSLFAAVPYLIRARQCLIMYTVGRIKRDSHRYAHVANAIKYSTSIWPLCVSVYQKLLPPSGQQAVEPWLIGLVVINSCYSLYWDVVMDWGFFAAPTAIVGAACGGFGSTGPKMESTSYHHALLRPRLRYGVGVSVLILLADTVLRFSWLLRFYHALFPSNDAFVLATQFLEIFRRALWNLLRVEWEQLKHLRAASQPNKGTLMMVEIKASPSDPPSIIKQV